MEQTPPLQDEVEVSVFGPGYGESIVLHLGDGRWAVVDSCVDIATGKVVPLDYLDSLGVDAARDIEFILATHWHDDHVKGLASLVEASHSAPVICSTALRHDEFAQLVSQADENQLGRFGSGVDELRRVLRILQSRNQSPTWAVADRRVAASRGSAGDFEAWALSPSDESATQALTLIGGNLARRLEPKRRVPRPSRNDATVALWIGGPQLVLLLGGDLEEQGNPRTGWSAVVRSDLRPQERADIYKAAHHGSEDSFYEPIWSDLLSENPITVVAPWRLGGESLPTTKGLRLLCDRSSEVHVTSTQQRERTARSRAIAQSIKESVRYITQAESPTGHVRIRARNRADASMSIEHSTLAVRAC